MVKEVVRKPIQDDVEYLIANIRPEDAEEIDALDGSSVRRILDETPDLLKNSLVWEVNGRIVCMFGVTPIKEQEGMGIIWLLATEEFDKYSRMFVVRCKRVFKEVMSKYEYVFNYAHSKNVKSIRWLEWLGFTIQDPEPLGHKGANFNRFEMLNV